MTAQGLLLDLGILGVILVLALLEGRRGAARAVLGFAAMLVALVTFPLVGLPLARLLGGSLLDLCWSALIIVVVAYVLAALAARRLEAARRGTVLPGEEPDTPRTRRAGRRLARAVGAVEGLLVGGLVALLFLYLPEVIPDTATAREGSAAVRLMRHLDAPLMRLIMGSAPEPPPGITTAPGTHPGNDPGTHPPAHIEDLAHLTAMQAVMQDPELLEAIRQHNYHALVRHPRLLELWEDPAFRRYLAGQHAGRLSEERQRLEQLNEDLEQALQAYHGGRHPEALAACQRVASVNPDYAHILITQAMVQEALGEDEEAHRTWEQARQRYLESPVPSHRLGVLAQDREDLGRAEELYTEALTRSPDYHYAAHNRGILRFRQGRYLEALPDLARALQVHPEDVEVAGSHEQAISFVAGNAVALLQDLGQTPGASVESVLGWYREFPRVCPDLAVAHLLAGRALGLSLEQGGPAELGPEALQHLRLAQELPASEQLHRWARLTEAMVYLATGDLAPARAILASLLAAGQGNINLVAEAYTQLALHHARKGDPDRGRQYMGLVQGILRGTRSRAEPYLAAYREVDPQGELADPEDLLHLVGGQRLTLTEVPDSVVCVPVDGELRQLQPGDVMVEIEGVEPRWPAELRELTLAAMEDPPVHVTVERDGERLEVAIQRGFSGVRMEAVLPYRLLDEEER